MAEEKKKKIEEWQERFNDIEFLKNVRTVLIFIIAIGAPILYFGFFDSLTLETLLTYQIGTLAILSIFLIGMIRIDIKARAFDDEINHNEKLQQVENGIDEETAKISNHYLGHKYVELYNANMQKSKDEEATEKQKNKLNLIKARFEVAGKFKSAKYKRICARIEDLKEHKVRGKYKPITYADLYTVDSKREKNSLDPRSNLRYSPKKESPFSTTSSIALKGSAIGGAGALPFIWSASFTTILIFYATFFVAIFQTVIMNYIKTRNQTKKRYYATRKFKLCLLKECNAYIAKHSNESIPTPQPVKKEEPKPEPIKEEAKPEPVPPPQLETSPEQIMPSESPLKTLIITNPLEKSETQGA